MTVQPNSPKQKAEVVGDHKLKVWVKSPPFEGRANKELINFLKRLLRKAGASPRVKIVGGHTSRIKQVEVDLTWQQLKHVIDTRSRSSAQENKGSN